MTATAIRAIRAIVTYPGVYDDMPDHVYHADPVPSGSLSSTGARRLIPPYGCPALFHHERVHGRNKPNKEFDFGHVAHRNVLGAGLDVEVVDAPDWRSGAAQHARAAARERGAVPLLARDYAKAERMAAALRAHDLAGPLFTMDGGVAERSLFWVDRATRVWCRARLDWSSGLPDGRMMIIDYKTTESSDPARIERSIADHGLHIQRAWYIAGVRALGLCEDPEFLFVFQEKEPPFLVTVVRIKPESAAIGDLRAREALHTYADCQRANRWPGYSDVIEPIGLPAWVVRQYRKEIP